MKHRNLNILLVLLLVNQTLLAQKLLDIRFEIDNVDCEDSKVYIDLEARNADVADYILGSISLRFTFNDLAIENPQFNTAFMGGEHLVNFQDGVYSYGIIILTGKNILPMDSGWQKIGKVEFDLIDATQNMELRWNRNYEYPPTTVQEFVSFVSQPDLQISDYVDLSSDLTEYCEVATGVWDPWNQNELNVFPIPTNNWIHICAKWNSNEITTYKVYNMIGMEILNGLIDESAKNASTDVNVGQLNPGNYMLTVTNGKDNYHKKIQVIK